MTVPFGTDHFCAHGEPLDGCQVPGCNLLAGVHDGAWLDAQVFPPLRYAVPGILPEGSTLLVGPPKIGKSWAVLDLLLAVAAGGRAFGVIPTGDPRPVLYLALEDGDRRLQDRCRKLLRGEPIPREFHYLTRVPPGGHVIDVIAEWTERHPDTAAVVLDTLGKVMPPAIIGESAYARDYRIGGRLKMLADERSGLSLLTNHHDRKAGSEDFVDSVSGTHGLAGSADTVLVLTRPRQETTGTLKITGRDVPEGEYALVFEHGMSWQVYGGDLAKAAEAARTRRLTDDLGDRSAAIVELAADRPDGIRAADVAGEVGIDTKAAGEYLRRLAGTGRLVRLGRGLYGYPAPLFGVGSVGSVELPGHGPDGTHTVAVESVGFIDTNPTDTTQPTPPRETTTTTAAEGAAGQQEGTP